MYLLDTNHCSLIMEGDPPALAHLSALGAARVGTSVIVRGELMYMVAKSQRQASNLARVHAFLDGLQIYEIDNQSSDIYGRLKASIVERFGPKDRSKRSKVTTAQLGISDNDIWIAATAIQHNLTIVSLDSDFRRMQEAMAVPSGKLVDAASAPQR